MAKSNQINGDLPAETHKNRGAAWTSPAQQADASRSACRHLPRISQAWIAEL